MSWARRPKRVLSPEQKYDLWVRMLTGQLNQADAAVLELDRRRAWRWQARAAVSAVADRPLGGNPVRRI